MARPTPYPISAEDLEAVRQSLCRRFGFWVKDDWLGRLREKIHARMDATDHATIQDYPIPFPS